VTALAPVGTLLRRARRDLGTARRELHADDLTGLANRRAFLAELDRARRDGRPVAVALLDVNRFKRVNDEYGHEAGDRVLCELADRLRVAAGRARLCARIAGDEFVLLIDGDAATAVALARVVWRAVAATPVPVGEHRLELTVSVGVAAAAGAGYERLLAQADLAMYRAKRTCRGVSVHPLGLASRGAA